ncbi:hypothetical protein ABK249_32495 [Neorhizobium sp. Rsf11]|uniref:Uncharacterized protein n=2 Tax=Neorhizobium TaxID=1525371 RepID=A0ABV0MEV4_9HYPH|nr:hypothetical protein [Neorhizobium petrolearium]MCC2614563.1 hypothetical protein [Neorhizobium petrolearium]WGI72322.1 hypothetical protein QEO92_32830 [Neorhizobium petrolearium]
MSQSTRSINRSAADAWSQLVKSGALDIDGRDKEFAETVCKMLDPTAADLADALAKATTDQLIKVFFRALQPFSGMYREILRFFKTAGAKYGRDQWRIGITDEHLELSDFEDFLRMWDGVPGEIDVPAVGQEGFGVVWLAWEAYPQLGNLANRAAREPAELGIAASISGSSTIDRVRSIRSHCRCYRNNRTQASGNWPQWSQQFMSRWWRLVRTELFCGRNSIGKR